MDLTQTILIALGFGLSILLGISIALDMRYGKFTKAVGYFTYSVFGWAILTFFMMIVL